MIESSKRKFLINKLHIISFLSVHYEYIICLKKSKKSIEHNLFTYDKFHDEKQLINM